MMTFSDPISLLLLATAPIAPAQGVVMEALSVLLVVAAIIVLFSLTVFVHEFGHYWVAKKLGLKIETFSIGFGPAIAKWISPRTGIKYQIAWIPLGGFVALPQMDPVLDRKRREALAAGKEPPPPSVAPWKRILVALAGGAMNIVLALGLSVVLWKTGVEVGFTQANSVVGYVDAESPAAAAGMKAGDRLVKVGGSAVETWQDVFTEFALKRDTIEVEYERAGVVASASLPLIREKSGFQHVDGILPVATNHILGISPDSAASEAGLLPGDVVTGIYGKPVTNDVEFKTLVQAGKGSPTEVLVQRKKEDGQIASLSFKVTPRYDEDDNRFLVGIRFDDKLTVFLTPGEQMSRFSKAIFRMLKAFTKRDEARQAFDGMGGPVAIFTTWYTILKEGIVKALWFTALINVNLAIMNLLPIIILDGGHIMIALYEMLFRRPPNERVLAALTNTALVLLLTLVVLITIRDSTRVKYYLGRGDGPPPAATSTNAVPGAVTAP